MVGFTRLPTVCSLPAIILCSLMGAANSVDAQAGKAQPSQFRLEQGAQFELCRQYAENLNSFPNLPERVCNVPFRDNYTNFRRIEWEPLDPAEHFQTVKAIWVQKFDPFKSKGAAEVDGAWKKIEPDIRRDMAQGKIKLGRARIDLNHDGKVDTVYHYTNRNAACSVPGRPPQPSSLGSVHVLGPPDENLKDTLRRYRGGPGDAFYYKGRVYLAQHLFRIIHLIEPTSNREGQGLFMHYVCILNRGETSRVNLK